MAKREILQINTPEGEAILANGQLWDWGMNDAGQLGYGTPATQTAPKQVPGITDALMADGGRDYSVLLRGSAAVLGRSRSAQR